MRRVRGVDQARRDDVVERLERAGVAVVLDVDELRGDGTVGAVGAREVARGAAVAPDVNRVAKLCFDGRWITRGAFGNQERHVLGVRR